MRPIAIVDPDEEYLERARLLCEANGAKVQVFADALAYIQSPIFSESHVSVVSLIQAACNGIDIVRSATSQSSAVVVIGVVDTPDIKKAVEAMRLGAADVMQKPISVSPIIEAAKTGAPSAGSGQRGLPGMDRLSRRERQVLDYLVKGETSRQIAQRWSVSTRTVEAHRSKILSKLGLRSHHDLVRQIRGLKG